jgi:hypothetical protein
LADLNFQQQAYPFPGNEVDLEFAPPQSTGPDTSAAMHIRLAPPAVHLRAAYDNRMIRKVESVARVRWQRADPTVETARAGWNDTGHHRQATGLAWAAGSADVQAIIETIGSHAPRHHASHLRWDTAVHMVAAAGEAFGSLPPLRQASALAWQMGERLAASLISPFVWLAPLPRHQRLGWQTGVPVASLSRHALLHGMRSVSTRILRWERTRQPPFGESHLPGDPPVEPPSSRRHPNLDFTCPAAQSGLAWRPWLRLDFGKPPCRGFSVPVLKVYVVNNTVEIVRLPGREPIPVKRLQLGIDVDSWAWGFSASLPYKALDMIAPTSVGPVEIEIHLNGLMWTMLVEGFEVRREFGQSTLDIQGRSLAAYLAEPYAPKRSFSPSAPFTARQLAEQELTRAGLATGFDLDWQLPDWLVPADSWSYQGLSPMSVMTRIANAAGGYVNAHASEKRVLAKSRYPALPWHWDTLPADMALPIDVVKTLHLRWQEKPAFNAVYVCGEHDGVIGRVIRTGSAGDAMAPMVVDGLITHADAARERGRSILADIGKQALVTLELPMLEAIGLLDPGLLVAVGEGNSDWRGLVRATSISATWDQSLTVRQTIEVERHYS